MSISIGELVGTVSLEDRFTRSLDVASVAAEKFVHKTESGFKTLTKGALAFAGTVTAITGTIVALANKGSTLNDLDRSFERLAGSVENAHDIMAAMNRGVADTVDSTELLQFANKALESGSIKTAEGFETVTKAARILSKQGLGSVESVLGTLNNALATGQTRVLKRMLGIIDLKKAEEEYAKSIGTTREMLSAEGRLHAAQIAIMDRFNKKIAETGELQKSLAERFKTGGVMIGDWFDGIAKAVAASPKVTKMFDAIGESLVKNFGGTAKTVQETVIKWIERFADGMAHYGPIVIDWLKRAWDWVTRIVDYVKSTWNSLPDWFKTIAKDAAIAGVALWGVKQAFDAVGSSAATARAAGEGGGGRGGLGLGIVPEVATTISGFESSVKIMQRLGGAVRDTFDGTLWKGIKEKIGDVVVAWRLWKTVAAEVTFRGAFQEILTWAPRAIAAILGVANPVGLVIAVMTALTVATRLLTGSWEFILDPMRKAWQGLKDISTIAGEVGDYFSDKLGVIVKEVGSFFEDVGFDIEEAMYNARDAVDSLIGSIERLLAKGHISLGFSPETWAMIDKLMEKFDNLPPAVKNVAKEMVDKLPGTIWNPFNAAAAHAIDLLHQVAEGIRTAGGETRKISEAELTDRLIGGVKTPAIGPLQPGFVAGGSVKGLGAAAPGGVGGGGIDQEKIAALAKQAAEKARGYWADFYGEMDKLSVNDYEQKARAIDRWHENELRALDDLKGAHVAYNKALVALDAARYAKLEALMMETVDKSVETSRAAGEQAREAVGAGFAGQPEVLMNLARASAQFSTEMTAGWQKVEAEGGNLESRVLTMTVAMNGLRGGALLASRDLSLGFGRLIPSAVTEAERMIVAAQNNMIKSLMPVSAEVQDLAKRMYDAGFSAEEIGAHFGLSMDQVVKAVGRGKMAVDTLLGSLKKLPMLMAEAFTGGGGLGGAFKALFATMTSDLFGADGPLANVTTAISNTIGKGLGKLLGSRLGAALGEGISQLLPGLGGLLAPLLEKLGQKVSEFFGGPSKEELAGRDAVKQVESFIDGFLKAADRMEAGGEQWRKTVIGLREGFEELGFTAEEAMARSEALAEKLWAAAKQGPEAVAKVEEEIRAIFELRKKLDELKAVKLEIADIQLGNAAAVLGILSEQVETWRGLNEELKKAKKGTKEYDEILAKLSTTVTFSAQELNDMGTIAVASFGAAIAQGKTFSEALAIAGPGLADLADAFKALGITAEDAYVGILARAGQLLERNPALIKAIGALGESFTALNAIGKLTPATFRAIERTGMSMYTRIQSEVAALGGGTEDALLQMQDFLHRAAEEAERLNIPLDEGTQILINQSKELGIWKDRGKSATDVLIEQMGELVAEIKELVEILGKIPDVDFNVTAHHQTEGAPTQPNPAGGPDLFTMPDIPGDGSGAGTGWDHVSMAEGGLGYAAKPMTFTTQGNEFFAFSGEGQTWEQFLTQPAQAAQAIEMLGPVATQMGITPPASFGRTTPPPPPSWEGGSVGTPPVRTPPIMLPPSSTLPLPDVVYEAPTFMSGVIPPDAAKTSQFGKVGVLGSTAPSFAMPSESPRFEAPTFAAPSSGAPGAPGASGPALLASGLAPRAFAALGASSPVLASSMAPAPKPVFSAPGYAIPVPPPPAAETTADAGSAVERTLVSVTRMGGVLMAKVQGSDAAPMEILQLAEKVVARLPESELASRGQAYAAAEQPGRAAEILKLVADSPVLRALALAAPPDAVVEIVRVGGLLQGDGKTIAQLPEKVVAQSSAGALTQRVSAQSANMYAATSPETQKAQKDFARQAQVREEAFGSTALPGGSPMTNTDFLPPEWRDRVQTMTGALPDVRTAIPMRDGGFGHADEPMVFSTRGDEDFAFSSEGQTFQDFLGMDEPEETDRPAAPEQPIILENYIYLGEREIVPIVVKTIRYNKGGVQDILTKKTETTGRRKKQMALDTLYNSYEEDLFHLATLSGTTPTPTYLLNVAKGIVPADRVIYDTGTATITATLPAPAEGKLLMIPASSLDEGTSVLTLTNGAGLNLAIDVPPIEGGGVPRPIFADLELAVPSAGTRTSNVWNLVASGNSIPVGFGGGISIYSARNVLSRGFFRGMGYRKKQSVVADVNEYQTRYAVDLRSNVRVVDVIFAVPSDEFILIEDWYEKNHGSALPSMLNPGVDWIWPVYGHWEEELKARQFGTTNFVEVTLTFTEETRGLPF